MASRCMERAVQEFLMERGGRVQQMELIDHFLSAWGGNDQAKGEAHREVLKHIVDNVGFVKVENGVNFVCLNASGRADSAMRTDADGHDDAECNGNIHETLDNNCINGNPDNRAQTGEGDVPVVVILSRITHDFSFLHVSNVLYLYVCLYLSFYSLYLVLMPSSSRLPGVAIVFETAVLLY